MSDLDLAALTEAANEALLRWWPSSEELDTDQVRAVLEALPREWGHEHTHDDGTVLSPGYAGTGIWQPERPQRCDSWRTRTRCRVVWRAVGPPIPAEEEM